MRCKLWLIVLFLSVCLANGLAQANKAEILAGDWYLVDENTLLKQDTLVFQKQLVGDTFNLWSFKSDRTLTKSNGSIRGNNPNAKCFASVLHYKWSINKIDGSEVLEIRFGDRPESFYVHKLSKENLILIPSNK